MTDEPKSGTEMLMRQSLEVSRLHARDVMVARQIARAMLEKHFKPESVEDMRDLERAIVYASEEAAYEAIQKERELHAQDMEMLKKWADAKWAEHMLSPRPLSVKTPQLDPSPRIS